MDTKTNLRFMLVVFLFLFLKTNISLGADTISANQSLSGDQTIMSAGGVFVLGFFHPGKSSNYYIGIWYKQVTEQTVVWVANREKPVSDRFSSELKIYDGNLVLFNESKIPIWSTNVNTDSVSVQAFLQDNGNLVLKDGSNSSKPLWESFNHLTDTLLPGCKFGYNKKTKTKQLLTSWKNPEDPAPGLFSIEPTPSYNSFTILWNRSREYWSSGAWNGNFFSMIPEMRLHVIYNFSYVTNENESYFIYFVENTTRTVSRLVMDVSGQLKQPLWQPPKGWTVIWSFPRQQCQVYSFCGAFGSCSESSLPFCSCLKGFERKSPSSWDLKDYSGGCIRKTKLECQNYSLANGKRDRFLEIPAMSLPENKKFAPGTNVTECESICLSDCSCTAHAYDYERKGCLFWIGDLLNLKQLRVGDNSGMTLYVRLAASEFQSTKNIKGLLIGIVVSSVAGSLILLSLVLFLILRRIKKIVRTGKGVEDSLVVFGYRDLQNATKNFSEKLGEGGFGLVFKGILPDSTEIAVKKLDRVGQGEKEFRTEVCTIGMIQHINLIRLRGFCSQGSKKLLVYDYMTNGSLASHLFSGNKSNVLNWKTRYQIALGTARGLVYLHEKCRDCIIHCDIKPENILLDAEFLPKVADFGLAKLIGREFSRVLTTIRGTRGYLAPEWIAGVAITTKADVYSYGMMLFELVSGKRNSEQYELNGKVNYFPSVAASVVVQSDNVLSLLDPSLEGNAEVEEVERVCKVACWCIQDGEAHRPSMSQVVQILEGVIEVNLPPLPQSLYFCDEDY